MSGARSARRSSGASPDPTAPRSASACAKRTTVVPVRQPDRPRPRRCIDVRRRAQRVAAAVAAPAGDGRRRGALGFPRRSVGTAGPHQPLPRRHDVRLRGRRRGRDRPGAGRAPPGAGAGPGRSGVFGVRPAPAVVGPRRRGRDVPAGVSTPRRAAAGSARGGRVRRPVRRGRQGARRHRRSSDHRRAAGGPRRLPSRAAEHSRRPIDGPLPARQPAAAVVPPRALPAARRGRGGAAAALGPVAAAPAVAAGERGHRAPPRGEAVTRTIRWALPAGIPRDEA